MKLKTTSIILLVVVCILTMIGATWAQEAEKPAQEYKFIAMAIAVSVPSVGAGYAVAKTGTAAAATITEKPELFGRTIVYVGMAEGIAIYGLLIAFLIWI